MIHDSLPDTRRARAAGGHLNPTCYGLRLDASVLIAVLAATAACSPATMGMNRMAAALSATADAYARDDDPEFVRTGAPATLKMVEMMLDSQPSHPGCC